MLRVTWALPSPDDDQLPIAKSVIEARYRGNAGWRVIHEIPAPATMVDVRTANLGLEELRLTLVDAQGVPSEPTTIPVRSSRKPPSPATVVSVSVVP